MMASQEILDLRNHGGEETFAERLARKSNPVTDSPETHEEQNTLFTIAINKTIINSWQLRDIYTINMLRIRVLCNLQIIIIAPCERDYLE